MKKEDKILKLKVLEEEFKQNKHFIFAEYKGLKTEQMNLLRRKLKEVNSKIMVIKNTLAKIAYKNANLKFDESWFEGPLSIVFCKDEDFVKPLKVLYNFRKENEFLNIKFGILENKIYEAKQLKELSELPPKQELLVKLLNLLNSPIYSFLFTLKYVLLNFINVLKEIEKKKK